MQFFNQKLNDLEYDKKFIESVEYQKFLDNQKRLEQRIKFKNDTVNDLDKFYQKKHVKLQILKLHNLKI